MGKCLERDEPSSQSLVEEITVEKDLTLKDSFNNKASEVEAGKTQDIDVAENNERKLLGNRQQPDKSPTDSLNGGCLEDRVSPNGSNDSDNDNNGRFDNKKVTATASVEDSCYSASFFVKHLV